MLASALWLMTVLSFIANSRCAEISLEDPGVRQPKVLMNLGGIFGEPFCFPNGSSVPTGICKNELTCVKEQGSLTDPNTCNLLQGHCCEYRHGCGDTSRQRVAYWQSNDYPTEAEETGPCSFTLRPASNVCYIKVEFLDLMLDSQISGQCMANAFYVVNPGDGVGSPFCGTLTGYEMFIKVKQTQTLNILTTSDPVAFFMYRKTPLNKFSVRFTQIPCDQVDVFEGRSLNVGSAAPVDVENEASLPETVREARRKDPSRPKQATPTPVCTSNLGKSSKKGNRRRCGDDSTRSQFPPTDSAFKFSFRESNVFTEVVEKKVSNAGSYQHNRVAGGNPVANITEEFPWLGYLLLKNRFDAPFFCGAVLIGEKYVLTAAHCVTKKGYSPTKYELKVRFGRTSLANSSSAMNLTELFNDPEAVGVKRVVPHSMFDYVTLEDDIALLELESAVPYTPIKLASANRTYDGLVGTIIGWGYTDINSNMSTIPNSLDVQILNNDECDNIWRVLSSAYTYTFPRFVQDNMVCTKANSTCAGACLGDSGGPLVVEESGSYTLVGILAGVYFNCVSSGSKIIGEIPDISTRVSEVLDFINIATSNPFD